MKRQPLLLAYALIDEASKSNLIRCGRETSDQYAWKNEYSILPCRSPTTFDLGMPSPDAPKFERSTETPSVIKKLNRSVIARSVVSIYGVYRRHHRYHYRRIRPRLPAQILMEEWSQCY